MIKVRQAILWALVIIGMAGLTRAGVFDPGAATTLLFVLPVLAWLSITGRSGRCGPRGA